MYANCFGIKKQEDIELVKAFLEANSIQHKVADPLTLFEENEAEYRLTELYKAVDVNGKHTEATEDLILDVADALGDSEYFDYDALDDIILNELKEHGLTFDWNFDYQSGDNLASEDD